MEVDHLWCLQTHYEEYANINCLRDSGWIWDVVLSDPLFVSRLNEKWLLFRKIWEDNIPRYIEEQYNPIYREVLRNEVIWSNWHPIFRFPEKTYEQVVDEMREAFVEQLQWMDTEINDLTKSVLDKKSIK